MAKSIRAFAYGYSAILLGIYLHRRGLSGIQAGLVLSAILAGSALGLLAVGRMADRIGRRRVYFTGYILLALAGMTVALSPWWWLMILAAFSGTLSAEVMDSGPFSVIEHVMLSNAASGQNRIRNFGTYNAVAAASGSFGALLAGIAYAVPPGIRGQSGSHLFILLVPLAFAGAICAVNLSPAMELQPSTATGKTDADNAGERTKFLPPPPMRSVLLRLSALFGMDAFGAGFAVQAFISYWLSTRFGADTVAIGALFLLIGASQTLSMFAAAWLGRRFGLLPTMVFTHLPSNFLMIAVAFAPNFPVAAGLLVARAALSEMDMPARQAYVMALVVPEERTRAASTTSLARYIARPAGPILAGLAQNVSLGFPFLISGVIKGSYDLILWIWFKHVPLSSEEQPDQSDSATEICDRDK